jgi:hypothetical protein
MTCSSALDLTPLSRRLAHLDPAAPGYGRSVYPLAAGYVYEVLDAMLHSGHDVDCLVDEVLQDVAAVPVWPRVCVAKELSDIFRHTLGGPHPAWVGEPLLASLELACELGLIDSEQRVHLALWIADALWAEGTTGGSARSFMTTTVR